MFNKIVLLCFIVMFSSCTTIHYRSEGKIPVSLTSIPGYTKDFTVSGKKEFFLWGLVPSFHQVYLDEFGIKNGLDGMSKIIVYEHLEPLDALWSFLSLGIYTPRTYTVTGFTNWKE